MKLIYSNLFICICCISLVNANPYLYKHIESEKEWWQTAVFYQIYPRSFQDSNDDGIGDLNGIRNRLNYIQSLGVTSIWLSPIFKSPMVDTGYDISDYREISPDYGTMDDFDALIKDAKALGIRVVLDFVPNHTSDQHEWFVKSVQRIEPFTDYYVWANPKIVNGTKQPPSNWLNEFSGTAWEFNEQRGQYYLHQFTIQQPDLNYRSSHVVEEMKDVLRFWMDRGVAGFRVDTMPSLFEVATFTDEPKSGEPNCKPTDFCYLNHIYTRDLNESIDMLVQWRAVLKEYSAEHKLDSKVLMTECGSPIDIVMRYYGNSTHDGACFTFNFQLIQNLHNTSNADDFKAIVDLWLKYLPAGRTSNWVLGNHDQRRVADRLGKERVDALNIMLMTLPGVGVTYNGEEIGMEDGFVSWEDTQDPEAIAAGPDHYLEVTRDLERTPFQWDSSKNAGFSKANKTWLPVSDKYKETNVKNEVGVNESHYEVYKRLTELRKHPTLIDGDLVTSAINSNVLTILRQLINQKTFLSLLNLGNENETVDLSKIKNLPPVLTIDVASVGSQFKQGTQIQVGEIDLKPNEAYVLSG